MDAASTSGELKTFSIISALPISRLSWLGVMMNDAEDGLIENYSYCRSTETMVEDLSNLSAKNILHPHAPSCCKSDQSQESGHNCYKQWASACHVQPQPEPPAKLSWSTPCPKEVAVLHVRWSSGICELQIQILLQKTAQTCRRRNGSESSTNALRWVQTALAAARRCPQQMRCDPLHPARTTHTLGTESYFWIPMS